MVCYIDINKTANLFFPLPRDFKGRWYMWDTFWYCLHPCRMLQPTRSSGGIDTTAMIMCSVFVWFPFNFILLVFEDEISMQIWIVCLFASTHLETSPLPVKGNSILVNHGNSLKMCHAYCDLGIPFIIVTSEDPWHPHLLPRVWQWRYHFLF